MFFACLACFAVSLVLSFALTWVVRNRAVARGWVALPQSRRHIHIRPVPRLGGVAIFLAISVTLGLLYLVSLFTPLAPDINWAELVPVFLPATLIFLLGVYDDLRGVGPYTKFGVQTVAAVLVFMGGLRIVHLPILFGNRELGWSVSLVLTIFWILWITNAFNLIDGVDGLAAGSALFSTVVVFIASTLNHIAPGLIVTAVLSGALLGFLRFNFNPATIFLGDSGSLLVGFMIGAVALNGQKSPTMVAVAIPVVSCGLPMLETAISVLRRFLSGRPIFGADREHIHHKLLQRGLSQRQVTYILYGVSAVFGLLSLVLLLPGGGPVALVLIVLGGITWLAVQHLGYHEFFELRRVAQRTIVQKQIIINNLAIRRGIEELERCRDLNGLESALLSIFAENDFDGFKVRYALKDRHPLLQASSLHQFTLDWNKPGNTAPLAWTMSMELPGVTGEGSLTVYRKQSPKELMVDVNLLTVGFPYALGNTIRRLLVQRLAQLVEEAGDPHEAAAAQVERHSHITPEWLKTASPGGADIAVFLRGCAGGC